MPVALYDSLTSFELGIDFSHEPEKIVAGLQRMFQDRVDSGDWTRRDCRGHRIADEEPPGETRGDHS